MTSSTFSPPTPATTSPQRSWRLRPLLLIPLMLLLIAITRRVLWNAEDQLRASHFNNQTEALSIGYEQVLTGYDRSSQIIFDEVINQPDVLSLFAQAKDATPQAQDEIRQRLYELLIDEYQRLEALDLRQLHFHLPNNVSFLRFHQPDRFGDDLTDVRYTVKMVNLNQEKISGFEEGRIFNGFRYVFPLFYNNEHIGSVETSVSFSTIQRALNGSLPGGTNFMLRADVVEAKVFDDLQSNYFVSDLSADYAYDRAVIDGYNSPAISWETVQAINAALAPTLSPYLSQNAPFALSQTANGIEYLVTFIPLFNVENQPVGYIISYNQDNFLGRTRTTFILSHLVVSLSGLGIVVFLIVLDRGTLFINRQRALLAIQNAQLESANHALDIARQQAESANKLKSQFLASMSHELRTPMNAVLNFARFIREGLVGAVTSEQMELLVKVEDNGKHLLSLINDLLDASKIESGQLKLFVEDDVQLAEEMDAAEGVALSLLKDKPVELVTDCQPDLPCILGDRRRIRQIMLNLISNACKFTQEGQIELKLRREGDSLLFSVRDSGPGIPREEQELIFETFVQTQVGIRQGGGTGLGLPISRSLAEIHGGSLTVASVPGQGATFTVSLPIHNEALAKMKHEQDSLATA